MYFFRCQYLALGSEIGRQSQAGKLSTKTVDNFQRGGKCCSATTRKIASLVSDKPIEQKLIVCDCSIIIVNFNQHYYYNIFYK